MPSAGRHSRGQKLTPSVGRSRQSNKGKASQHKKLIVFSDMFEQSKRYDFTAIKLTDKRIEEIIKKEKCEGQLPNLTGVKVWVVGATADLGDGLSSTRIHQIQNFWLAYFKACGADLTSDRYAPTLLNFE